MNANEYRKSAQAHAVKAVRLMVSESGLTPTAKAARLEHVVSHLASALAHAAAARALTLDVPAPVVSTATVDVETATDDMVAGLEALLKETN